jgi:hypothetical protein
MESSENNFVIFDHQKKKTPWRHNQKNRELDFMTFTIFNFSVINQKSITAHTPNPLNLHLS